MSGSEPLVGFSPEPGLGILGILGRLGIFGILGISGSFGAFGGAETGDFGLLGEDPPVKDPDLGAVGLLDDDPEEESDICAFKAMALLHRR